jgi:hypothetical protein
MRMMMMLFWVLAPCRLIGRFQSFGEANVLIFGAEDGTCQRFEGT